MSSRDLSTLSPEELMELAKNPIKKEKDKNLSPVKAFIVSEDLQKGETQVPGIVVYDRYSEWCENNSIERLSVTAFFKEFKFYFTKKVTKFGAVYLLDSEGFDLSVEHKKILSDQRRKRISRNAKKTQKEKEDNQEE